MADILSSNTPAPNATSDMPQASPPVTTSIDPNPNTAPVATPVTTEPQPTPSPTPTEPPYEPIKVRISEIAQQRRAADERAARLEALATQQSEQLREALETISRLTTTQQTQVPIPPDAGTGFTDPRPVREAYSEPLEFESALVSWAGQKAAYEAAAVMRSEQETRERERVETERKNKEAADVEAERARQEEINTRTQTAWNERKAKTAEKYADYTEIAENPDLPVSIAMAHTLMNSEDGGEILYYLGKHPEESARIASMIVPGQVFPSGMGTLSGTPIPDGPAQAFELGKIATKLGLDIGQVPTEPPVTPPNALAPGVNTPAIVTAPPVSTVLPAPPAPLSGASAVATNRDPNNMTMDEYAAMRSPQIRAQRSPGRSQLQ